MESSSSLAIDPSTRIGVVVGNYRIERSLGSGGMADVYLLSHRTLPDTWVAMKVLRGVNPRPGAFGARDAGATRGDSVETLLATRFEQEARVAAALGSPRVAAPLDMGQLPDGTPYILMEYVRGQTLEQRLSEAGALDVSETIAIALEVADTMTRAHALGIVHRDLKPANIMLGADGAVRLLDFGIARASGDLRLVHTTARVLLGTPGYIAPEALAGDEVSAAGDVFSLGVTLYRMLSGALPFPNTSTFAAATAMLKKAVPALASLRPRERDPVPRWLELLIRRALQVTPERRPSMRELHAALSSAARSAIPRPQRRALAIGAAFGAAATLWAFVTISRHERLPAAGHMRAALSAGAQRSAPKLLPSTRPQPLPSATPVRAAPANATDATNAANTTNPKSRRHNQRIERRAPGELELGDPVKWMEE